VEWVGLAQDARNWQAVMGTMMKCGEFVDLLSSVGFSRTLPSVDSQSLS